jgi:hypothetical protein
MHCTGINAIIVVSREMPKKLVMPSTGNRVIFGGVSAARALGPMRNHLPAGDWMKADECSLFLSLLGPSASSRAVLGGIALA